MFHECFTNVNLLKKTEDFGCHRNVSQTDVMFHTGYHGNGLIYNT